MVNKYDEYHGMSYHEIVDPFRVNRLLYFLVGVGSGWLVSVLTYVTYHSITPLIGW